MAGFPMRERQKIIDDYLVETGSNQFDPAAFIDWLSGRPDHVAYPWFFGTDDATAAREHRILLARQFVNGLRITARVQDQPDAGREIRVQAREFPAMISPVAGRKAGGGYIAFSPEDPAAVAELRRQGAAALRAWLARYRAVAEMGGLDIGPIEEIAARLDGSVAEAA